MVTIGEGKYYSTGIDVNWLGNLDIKEVTRFLGNFFGLLARLLVFPLVTVAALNGKLTNLLR